MWVGVPRGRPNETMPEPNTFYLTTPIYYVNARPHLGHAYTTIAADVIARRERARRSSEQGREVFFLTGTDEHGQKIERSAAAAGENPQAFTDRVSAEFRGLWDRMGLTYDDYIRTTEERHKRGVRKLWNVLKERGFIYKGTYTGQYCVYDELYVEAGPGAPCPDCGRPTETVSEDNYFFKLSAFESKLLEVIWQPELGDTEADSADKLVIVPASRRNEVLSFIRGGLRDLSISRASFKWGIPVPGDEAHVVYVWLDALANYISALGYGSDDEGNFSKFWPAQLHIIGKEISRFHCVYWPAFLLAAGLPLPKQVAVHGWLLFEQSKMSKSRGNIVRAETVLDVLGADALRYFLLREVVWGQDGSFSFDALVQRYNADLANGYGNLVSRTLTMVSKYFNDRIPAWAGVDSPDLPAMAQTCIINCRELFEQLNFSAALESAWWLIKQADLFLTANSPWKDRVDLSPEQNRDRRASILADACEFIRIVTVLVYPVIPNAAETVWNQLGLTNIKSFNLYQLRWGSSLIGTKLGPLGPVFPRADKDAAERMQQMEDQNRTDTAAVPLEPTTISAAPTLPFSPAAAMATPPATAQIEDLPIAAFEPGLQNFEDAALAGQISTPAPIAVETVEKPEALPQITIDDFLKVELRVAQVLVAERVPKADKLLRLEVDLGYERRQILAGIAETYAPEALLGRKVVIVANLAPRKLRGLESNGMLLAASLGDAGKPSLAGFADDVELGARLR